MKLKEGDVLVCENEDCGAEIVVSKPCTCCESKPDIEVTCCGKPMVLKSGGCCCCSG